MSIQIDYSLSSKGCKILSTDNCILQQCYQEMLINIDTNNWLSGVRYISLSWFIEYMVLAECQFR